MTKNLPFRLPKIFATLTFAGTFFFLVLFISSFTQLKEPPKIKSRFYTMVLTKTTIDSLKALDPVNFDHFIFQCVNNNKDGLLQGRRVYMLVVYACKVDGTPINTNPVLLEISEGGFVKDAADREEKINLANYKLSKRQYETIIKGKSTFYGLRFEAVKSDNTHSHKSYMTYYISLLDTRSDDKIKPNRPLDEENYLKPSPPARPEP